MNAAKNGYQTALVLTPQFVIHLFSAPNLNSQVPNEGELALH